MKEMISECTDVGMNLRRTEPLFQK